MKQWLFFAIRQEDPGPATWEFGTYPEGKDDYPVSGVSWYEAAAYAEFAGKSLPTIYHWCRASGMRSLYGDIVRFSNFSTKGLARVGAYRGLGDFGTYDMAGNIKEWCWNQTGSSRYAMGGAWNETTDTFSLTDARPPFDRSADLGFRCVKYIHRRRTRVDPVRDTLLVDNTPIDYLDFASPVSGLGGKMGLDATNKWPGETQREWGTPIVMDAAVKAKVDAMWGELGL